jgi:D-methionine transport system permease protein
MLIQATVETLYMVFGSCLLAAILGVPLGACLYVTRPGGVYEKPWLYRILSSILNATRSLPFIIFMILLIPLTRKIMGTSIGVHAALVPLSLGAVPFIARLVETAFLEIPSGLIDMMITLGIQPVQLFHKVLIPESLPTLIHGITLTLISLVGYSAMAGTIGGGGLGDLAIRYGYQRFNVSMMISTVVILIVLVQSIQWIGDRLADKFNRKARVTQ